MSIDLQMELHDMAKWPWEQVEFSCSVCDYKVKLERCFKKHVIENHGDYGLYKILYGEQNSARFLCQLCQTQIKSCRNNVSEHLRVIHGSTLSQYQEMFGRENQPHTSRRSQGLTRGIVNRINQGLCPNLTVVKVTWHSFIVPTYYCQIQLG